MLKSKPVLVDVYSLNLTYDILKALEQKQVIPHNACRMRRMKTSIKTQTVGTYCNCHSSQAWMKDEQNSNDPVPFAINVAEIFCSRAKMPARHQSCGLLK